MKKIVTLAIALLCVISLSAQTGAKPKDDNAKSKKENVQKVEKEKKQKETEKKKTPKKTKEAEIFFEKTVHDYGTVTKGGNGECEFVFKNTGKTDLVLSNVRSSCGCTVPVWPKEPIPPKKSATIKVKYDTNRVGPINKTVTVESNGISNRIQLKITGNVINKPVEKAPENNNSQLTNPNNQ